MKKMLSAVLAFIIIFALSSTAYATGGYYVIKGENTYHGFVCDELEGYALENIRWYATIKEAKNAGMKPAECCKDYKWDYEDDAATFFYSTDGKIQSALDVERFRGIVDCIKDEEFQQEHYDEGYDDGYGTGKDAGYDDGYRDGKEYGYKDGYDVGYADGEENQERSNLTELLLLVIPCAMAFFFGKHCKQTDLESDLKKCRTENIKLSSSLKEQNDAMYVLGLISERSKMTIPQLTETLYINFRKQNGCSTEEARAELDKKKQNWPQNR